MSRERMGEREKRCKRKVKGKRENKQGNEERRRKKGKRKGKRENAERKRKRGKKEKMQVEKNIIIEKHKDN